MMRLLGAAILLVIFAAPAILGPPWVLLIIALIALPTCIYEFYRVGLDKNSRLLGWIGLAGSFPYLYSIYIGWLSASLYLICLVSLLIMAAGLILFEKQKTTALQVSIAIAGFIYPLVLTGFWLLVRNGIDGRFWMIFGLLCTFGADTGAYYVGKNFGKKALAPRLSPKKTWEGLVGGIGASMIGGTLFYLLYDHYLPLQSPFPLWLVIAVSGAISILDLMGDLAVSMYKRQFMVKDMGNLIPGHGGMLDRLDGVIPVGFLLYLAVQVAR